MPLTDVSCNILGQLANALEQLDPSDFSRPAPALSHASIGQHVRHTLEFFTCFERGLSSGTVNYDKRDHDGRMETDLEYAIESLDSICAFVGALKHNQPLFLEVGYDRDSDNTQILETNSFRELTYNIEHAVHHMAMIKIGLREIAPYVIISADFGVAASTLRHKASLLAEH